MADIKLPEPATIADAGVALRAGQVTAITLVEASLAAIDRHGARTNAFVRVDADGARFAARTADEERRRGVDRGPLHGIPISVKDLIDIAGQPTTAGSRVRAGHIAEHDAPVVRRLRDAGAVIIGKTNLHEFAFGTTSEESAFGAVHNPHDVTRSAGGSSGGSAAAVATGMGLASVGSDTGGSIRIPASACGVVGLKPSFGEVPADGVVPLSVSFDHVGPIVRTVQDAATMWRVLASREESHIAPVDPHRMNLAALGGYFTQFLEREVREVYDATLARLRALGATIDACTLDGADSIVETYSNISLPEAALWHAANIDARPGDYHPAVLGRLMRGRDVLAVDHLRARESRARLARAVDAALHGYHAIVLPTLPIVAPQIGTTDAAVERVDGKGLTVRAAMLRLTQLFNMTGHPAISLPMVTSGLPIGLQLVGWRDATEDLLAVAMGVEGMTSHE